MKKAVSLLSLILLSVAPLVAGNAGYEYMYVSALEVEENNSTIGFNATAIAGEKYQALESSLLDCLNLDLDADYVVAPYTSGYSYGYSYMGYNFVDKKFSCAELLLNSSRIIQEQSIKLIDSMINVFDSTSLMTTYGEEEQQIGIATQVYYIQLQKSLEDFFRLIINDHAKLNARMHKQFVNLVKYIDLNRASLNTVAKIFDSVLEDMDLTKDSLLAKLIAPISEPEIPASEQNVNP